CGGGERRLARKRSVWAGRSRSWLGVWAGARRSCRGWGSPAGGAVGGWAGVPRTGHRRGGGRGGRGRPGGGRWPRAGGRGGAPWRAGLEVSVLPRGYRDLLEVAEDAGRPLRAAQIAAAAGLSTDRGEGGDPAGEAEAAGGAGLAGRGGRAGAVRPARG